MEGASISEASVEGNRSNSILSRKRNLSSSDVANRDGKKRSTMLMDLEILDCPICYEALTIPIFQCDNGHVACSSCCPKLSSKCPACASSIGQIRCRAMESVLESIFVPCRNAKLGCTQIVSYVKESTHAKECYFFPCSCLIQGCNYTGTFSNIQRHLCGHNEISKMAFFNCGISFGVQMKSSGKIFIAKECVRKLLFIVQCFREPYGVYVNVSCFAPSNPEVGQFSYKLSYTVDGHTMKYESPEVKKVLQVSFQTPQENFMLIPNSFLRGEELEMKLCINKLN